MISERNAERILRITKSRSALHFWRYRLFEMLNDRPLSERKIKIAMKCYTTPTWLGLGWKRISQNFEIDGRGYLWPRLVANYQALTDLKDAHGFFCILVLLRLAEARKNNSDHIMHATNAYRIFPFAMQNPLLAQHTEKIKRYLDLIVHRVGITTASLKVDWKAIDQQIADARFISSHRPITYEVAAKASNIDSFHIIY